MPDRRNSKYFELNALTPLKSALTQITAWHASGRLIIDADFESRWRPLDEPYRLLALDVANGRVDLGRLNSSAVQHATADVFALPRVALDELCVRMKARLCNLLC